MRKEETGMAPISMAKPGRGKRGQREGVGRQCLEPAAKKERGGAERTKGWEVDLGLTNIGKNLEHRTQRHRFKS